MINYNNILTDVTTEKWLSSLKSTESLVAILIISVLNGILVLFASQRYMLALQQFGYNNKKYNKWLKDKDNNQLSRLLLLCLMSLLFFCVWSLTMTAFFKSNEEVPFAPAYLGFIVYLVFMFIYIGTERAVRKKMPLKGTKRIVRLGTTHVILTMVATFIVCLFGNGICLLFKNEIIYILRYSFISVVPFIAPFVLMLANAVMMPFEKHNERYYVRTAKEILDKSDVIKIGITGSYGKTGVKSILNTILSEKYRVLATPKSYNTPMGISLAVKKMDSVHDIFIAEMGARKRGDITDLAMMVNPDIAVLTGINEQHLESFGNIETIKQTKFELFEHLKSGAKAFFSNGNKDCVELYNKYDGEKYLAGINDDDKPLVYAKDILTTKLGSEFVLVIDGEEIKCSTTLLGEHNVMNIALASAVAYKLGLTKEQICSGINKVRTVTHRLSIVPNNKGVIIIDDSYNSNTTGLDSAIEVVKKFEGRKIIVTPGLVELGNKQYEINEKVGELLAENFDKIIVIGKTNAEPLIKGLLAKGRTDEDVFFEKNSDRGNETLNKIIQTGDVVLFENDLPDTYI